jgi:deazaflavin-dependent oxidoreductase (nitroreductase family)
MHVLSWGAIDGERHEEATMNEYVPSPTQWVADQVELYERSGGTEGTTLRDMPVIIVSNRGRKTGATRKTPLMRVVDGANYVLVASRGGAPTHPLWYHNLKANPSIELRDGPKVHAMRVREVVDSAEKQRLWDIAVEAFPPYQDYQGRTERAIPVFLAEPA